MDETVYGIIYKLVFIKPVDDFYVGSTTQTLYTRKRKHMNDSKTGNTNKSAAIREHGDFNLEILVPGTFYKNIDALRQKEREFIELLKPTLNTYRPYITEEEYKEQNIENALKWALTRVICDICNKEIGRGYLTKHKKNVHK